MDGPRRAQHPRPAAHPLIRGADDELARASWDDALDLIVERLERVRETYGPDGVGVFGGGG